MVWTRGNPNKTQMDSVQTSSGGGVGKFFAAVGNHIAGMSKEASNNRQVTHKVMMETAGQMAIDKNQSKLGRADYRHYRINNTKFDIDDKFKRLSAVGPNGQPMYQEDEILPSASAPHTALSGMKNGKLEFQKHGLIGRNRKATPDPNKGAQPTPVGGQGAPAPVNGPGTTTPKKTRGPGKKKAPSAITGGTTGGIGATGGKSTKSKKNVGWVQDELPFTKKRGKK